MGPPPGWGGSPRRARGAPPWTRELIHHDDQGFGVYFDEDQLHIDEAQMAFLARASKSIPFDLAYGSLSSDLRKLLAPVGLDKATVWANIQSLDIPDDVPDKEHWQHNALLQILAELGEKERGNEWATELLPVIRIATEVAPELAARQGGLSSLELMSDFHDLDTAAQHSARATELQGMALAALAHLPQEWRGKRYRRTEGQATENAREEGERAERLRKGREVVGLLVEADLPFARELGPRALAGDLPLRCCRGLRSKTLAQRVSCWRPFRRWLVASGYPPFPSSHETVLQYMELRRKEGAPRTTVTSLLLSLKFLEEAGEVASSSSSSGEGAVFGEPSGKKAKVL